MLDSDAAFRAVLYGLRLLDYLQPDSAVKTSHALTSRKESRAGSLRDPLTEADFNKGI
jgi:hypothetical protein